MSNSLRRNLRVSKLDFVCCSGNVKAACAWNKHTMDREYSETGPLWLVVVFWYSGVFGVFGAKLQYWWWLCSATETAPALHRPWTPALHITYPMKIYLYKETCPKLKTSWKLQTFFKTMFWSSFPWGQSVRRNRVKTTKETKVVINLENFY